MQLSNDVQHLEHLEMECNHLKLFGLSLLDLLHKDMLIQTMPVYNINQTKEEIPLKSV